MVTVSSANKYAFEIIFSSLITVIVAAYVMFPPAGQAQVDTASSLNEKAMTLGMPRILTFRN